MRNSPRRRAGTRPSFPRVVPVAEAMTAMVLVDFLMMWNGYRSLRRDMEGPQLGQEILSAPDA